MTILMQRDSPLRVIDSLALQGSSAGAPIDPSLATEDDFVYVDFQPGKLRAPADLDDDTASTGSLSSDSYDSADDSTEQRRVSFSEDMVTDVWTRPFTPRAEVSNLFYSTEETSRYVWVLLVLRLRRFLRDSGKYTGSIPHPVLVPLSLYHHPQHYTHKQQHHPQQHHQPQHHPHYSFRQEYRLERKLLSELSVDPETCNLDDKDLAALVSHTKASPQQAYRISRVVVLHENKLETFVDENKQTNVNDFFDNDSFWSGSITWY